MEHEVLFAGIGGQGVQLAAQVLARAAVHDGRSAMMLGLYQGMMRGGSSDCTVVVGDDDRPIRTPPLVSRAGAAVVLHHEFWPPVAARLRPGARCVVDAVVFEGGLGRDDVRDIRVDPAGHPASLVLVAALAATAGLASIDALVAAMHDALPPYRRQHLEANADALRFGYSGAGVLA